MRSITTKFLPLLLMALPLSAAPSRINPANQIDWTKVSGVGVPTATCNSTFYGMPYTNRTNGDFYVCASTGWVLITGGSGSITVNGSSISNPNFNDTTPAAGTNGKNIAVQVTGSDVSMQLVGDGVTTHFLNGAGSYTTPAGGGTIGGSGTTNKIAKFTSSTDIGNSDITDDGTTVTSGKPLVIADGTGVAGKVALAQGTAATNETTSVSLTVPTSVTSYRLQLPSAHPSGSNTFISCTAADPAVCTFAAGGGGSGAAVWNRQGVVMAPGAFEPSPQIQEFSAILGAPEYPGFSAYTTVVKVAFTSGWFPTGGGGTGSNICFAESVDGKSPFVRVGTCLTGYFRGALKKFGSTYVLYAVNSSHQADVFTGTTLAGLTLASSNVLTCGSHGNEQANTLAHMEVWSTNNAGSTYNMLYDCATNSGFSGSYAIWKATSSGDYKGPWTKGSTTPVMGAGSSNQGTNTADTSGAFINIQSATALTAWAHTGPVGNVPTPYIYRFTSTDNGDSWAVDSSAMITSRTSDEGVDNPNGQIANVALLEFANQTYLYYSAYTDGCAGILICGIPSYEKLAAIALPLATVATTSTLTDIGGDLGQGKSTTVNGIAVSGNDNIATLYGAAGVNVADGGSGRAFIQQGSAASTFLGTAATAISSYTDTSLSTFALYASDGTSPQSIPLLDGYGNAIVAAGTTATFGDVLNSYTPGSADYTVSGSFKYVTSGGTPLVALFARAASGADTAYQFQCAPAAASHVCGTYKHVAGVSTQIGSNVNVGWQVGQTHFLQLKVAGTTIQGFVDGMLILSNTDSAISAVGQGGFRIVGGSSTSISNFNIWSSTAASTTVNSLTADSTGGAAAGTTFNGSVARTFDYHSFGALAAASGTFTGTPDASGATQFKLPVAASGAAAANGEQIFDSTNKNWHVWGNAVDNFMAVAPVASPPSNGDCAQWALAGGVLTLGHASGNCGTASSSAVTVNGGSTLGTANLNDTTPAAAANGLNVKFQNSGANVSAYVPGDGTATHYLSGAGTFTTPSGGAWTNITGTVTATGCSVSGGICTVSGSSTTVVTFSSIPGGHTMLRLEMAGVATSGATNGSVLTINGSTASDYQRIGDFSNGTAALGAITAASQTGCNGGQWSNTGISEMWFEFPFYASTSLGKSIHGETLNATAANSTTNTQHVYNKCVWLPGSPAAITSITETIGANDFAAGASFVLWAID